MRKGGESTEKKKGGTPSYRKEKKHRKGLEDHWEKKLSHHNGGVFREGGPKKGRGCPGGLPGKKGTHRYELNLKTAKPSHPPDPSFLERHR